MKQKNLILMVVAVGCGLVAAFLTTQINAKGPKVEQVEVLVAAKDLAVGTLITKADLPKLVTKKVVSKDSLPSNFVNDENELLDKRLSAPVLADGFFDPKYLSSRGVIIIPDGKDMFSISMSPTKSAAGFVGPGSHVDVLASMNIKNKLTAFPLLVDMQVLTVDTNTTYKKEGAFANMSMVSLAVTQEQALLLSMAQRRGCDLQLLLRHPNKPVDPNYNMQKIKALLEDDSKGGVISSAGNGEDPKVKNDINTPEGIPPSTPAQENKTVIVKVFKAKVDIAANTEITKDLIEQSLTTQEVPKDIAESIKAYQDLTPFYGLVFKNPVEKDQLISKGMFGSQSSKAAPADPFFPDKDPTKPEKAEAPKPEKRTHDVALYSSSGVLIYRYEEVRPGEPWKLRRVMSPEEAAARDARDAKSGDTGKSGDTPSAPQNPGPDEKQQGSPDEKPSSSGSKKYE